MGFYFILFFSLILLGILFLLHDWYTKRRCMCYPVCGMEHIKYILVLISALDMSSGNGLVGTGFASWYWLQPRAGYF